MARFETCLSPEPAKVWETIEQFRIDLAGGFGITDVTIVLGLNSYGALALQVMERMRLLGRGYSSSRLTEFYGMKIIVDPSRQDYVALTPTDPTVAFQIFEAYITPP